ncbi:MAG: CoA transferase [Gammaproteobacteria bacterium]|nr:CoA transferase [Gammaproteobacteria bacterium]
MTDATLGGLRVVDLGGRASTAWCSRLLADYGADVVMVEPGRGHPLRQHPPFDPDGRSTTARYFLANKRSAPPDERATLIAEADVIVADRDALELAQTNPSAVVCAITPCGLEAAPSRRSGNDLTAYARSGWASVNGLKDRPPLKGSGYQAAYQAGTMAYGSIVAALIERAASDGRGQVIDVSEEEVLVSTFAPAALRWQYAGVVAPRRESVTMNDGPVPVRDGYFALTLSRGLFWRKAMTVLGLLDLAEDKELQQPGIRQKHRSRYTARVEAAMAEWTRAELFDALGAERVVAGPAYRIDEMGENAQLVARGFFREMPGSGTRFPGPFARMTVSPWHLKHEMPDVAANDATYRSGGFATKTPVRAGADGQGPLAGFRGLVLTQAWAGTYATELLALLGADVIQLETRGRLDSWRGTYQNPIPEALKDLATAKHAWNCNPLYNSVNLNKRCITVDLATPEGVGLFKDLLAHVDFVGENFSPRVMGKLGIDYETLCTIKPDLVMASLSAYGGIGPWTHVPGIGGTIEPSSGMSALLGYEGERPQNSGQMYPDPVAGICGFAAIVTALLHRDRTGEGQFIDLSMQEANFTFIGDAWLEYEATGTVRGAQGNRHPLYAPHGIYPCDGEDQWVAVAAETDAQFAALAKILGLDAAVWLTNEERKAREAELDAAIARSTGSRDKGELAAALAEGGVPAAAVKDAREVVADAHLRSRGHLVCVDHPEAGATWQSGCPVQFSHSPVAVSRHAPLQGQHSFEVFHDLLGMTERRYRELVEQGVTGKGPLPPKETR